MFDDEILAYSIFVSNEKTSKIESIFQSSYSLVITLGIAPEMIG